MMFETCSSVMKRKWESLERVWEGAAGAPSPCSAAIRSQWTESIWMWWSSTDGGASNSPPTPNRKYLKAVYCGRERRVTCSLHSTTSAPTSLSAFFLFNLSPPLLTHRPPPRDKQLTEGRGNEDMQPSDLNFSSSGPRDKKCKHLIPSDVCRDNNTQEKETYTSNWFSFRICFSLFRKMFSLSAEVTQARSETQTGDSRGFQHTCSPTKLIKQLNVQNAGWRAMVEPKRRKKHAKHSKTLNAGNGCE